LTSVGVQPLSFKVKEPLQSGSHAVQWMCWAGFGTGELPAEPHCGACPHHTAPHHSRFLRW